MTSENERVGAELQAGIENDFLEGISFHRHDVWLDCCKDLEWGCCNVCKWIDFFCLILKESEISECKVWCFLKFAVCLNIFLIENINIFGEYVLFKLTVLSIFRHFGEGVVYCPCLHVCIITELIISFRNMHTETLQHSLSLHLRYSPGCSMCKLNIFLNTHILYDHTSS